MNKIYIMDTNILSCHLNVKSTVGNGDIWDKEKIQEKIEEITKEKNTIVVPLPVMIELGNQISNDKKYNACSELINIIEKNLDEKEPWHSFNEQKIFWDENKLKNIIRNWEVQAQSGINFGDFLIVGLAAHYALRYSGKENVELWTADNKALEAYKNFDLQTIDKRRENSKKRNLR